MTAETVFFILAVIFILCCITLMCDLPQLLPVFLCVFFIVLIANLDVLLEKQCTNCNEINYSGNDYCQICGEELYANEQKETSNKYNFWTNIMVDKYPLQCEVCNKIFKGTVNFCDDCGKALTNRITKYYCDSCDFEISKNDKFCINCGKDLK